MNFYLLNQFRKIMEQLKKGIQERVLVGIKPP